MITIGSDLPLNQVLEQMLSLTILFATPFLFAALGEVFSQRSGVLNLGIEGTMLMGAFTAIYVVSEKGLGQPPLVGLMVAIAIGGLMGLSMAIVSVTLQAEQGISGIGFTLLGLGMSSLLFKVLAGGVITAGGLGFQPIAVPLLSDLPLVGDVFSKQNILVYVAFGLVPLSVWILNKTNWGLQIRAVGENPAAADAMGVNVTRVRYSAVTLGGIMAGIAGASISIAVSTVFQENMTEGRGFIAVALVYFGSWSPWRVMFGALLFSFANNLQNWVQILNVRVGGDDIPPNLLIMAPFILTIVVLVFVRQRQHVAPSALTKPFQRGEN